MKRILFSCLFLATALFTIQNLSAQDKEKSEKTEPKFKKTKSYSKSYNLGGSDKVRLDNSFGEMKINTWDKNEVKVDVSITGKSDDEKRAQEILDRITILDGKEGNTVFFKTKMADDEDKKDHDKNEHHESHNEGMEIDYMVYLPAGNPLDASNQFGKMYVPDYRGEATISSKFGSLTAGKLSNTRSVNVEFGSAEIGQVNGGDLNIKFSHGTVGKLGGDMHSDLQFSQVKLNVDNDTKSLNINNSYSTVYLDLDKNFSATYDINTSHGGFSNKTGFDIKRQGDDDDRYGPRFNEKYTGTSGSGNCKVKISSSFGSVIAGHDLKVDLSQKNKTKPTRVI